MALVQTLFASARLLASSHPEVLGATAPLKVVAPAAAGINAVAGTMAVIYPEDYQLTLVGDELAGAVYQGRVAVIDSSVVTGDAWTYLGVSPTIYRDPTFGYLYRQAPTIANPDADPAMIPQIAPPRWFGVTP